jgi:DNA-binding NtrC family response regulator
VAKLPILLLGEVGTGHRRLARVLHRVFAGRESELPELDVRSLPPRPRETIPPGPGAVLFTGCEAAGTEALEALARDLSGHSRLPLLAFALPSGGGAAGPSLRLRELCRVVNLPSLRRRREDLPAMVEDFLDSRGPRAVLHLGGDDCRHLARHPWPGNEVELHRWLEERTETPVREEGGACGRGSLAALMEKEVTRWMKPLADHGGGGFLEFIISQVERQAIVAAMEHSGHNQAAAARLLGINRNTLAARMKRYGLPSSGRSPRGESA